MHGKKLNKIIIASCKIINVSGDMCSTIVLKTLYSILQSQVLFMCRTCTTRNVICWSRGTGAHVIVHFVTENDRGQRYWLEKLFLLILNGVNVMPRYLNLNVTERSVYSKLEWVITRSQDVLACIETLYRICGDVTNSRATPEIDLVQVARVWRHKHRTIIFG